MNYPKRKAVFRILTFVFVVLFFKIDYSMAQQAVKGRITSKDNNPLIGVSIIIKGTSNGVVSDLDGNYSIEVNSPEDTLVFSYVGYLAEEVKVGKETVIDIVLIDDILEFEEVIVTGYMTQKKDDLTGAISIVDAKDLEKSNANSLSKALQGRASGVTVMSTSGQPGGDVNIRVRGVGSINNQAQPIVVIDGVVTSTSELNSLNPQDVETISVLKDASAAAIYGAQSSNGVILVTTKKGRKDGKPQVQLNIQMGLSNVPKHMDIMDAEEYASFYSQAYASNNERFKDYPSLQATFPDAYSDSVRAINNYTNTNWQDYITVSNALSQKYNLSLSGGGKSHSYLISATHFSNEGILLNTSSELTSLRINTSLKIGKRITVGENFSFSVKKQQVANSNGNSWLMSSVSSPLMPIYNSSNEKGYEGPNIPTTGNNDRTNPFAELMLYEEINNSNQAFGNIFADIEIVDGLTFRTLLGINYNNKLNTSWKPKYDLGQRSNTLASLRENPEYYRKIQWDQILTYKKSIQNHNINVILGHSMEDEEINSIIGVANDFAFEHLRTLSNGDPNLSSINQKKYPFRIESYFGKMTYDYLGKYLLVATFRRDGSSKFGKNNQWGNFPAFSVGWKFNEDFLRNVNKINTLKLRVGWGKSGNNPDDPFLYNTFLSGYNEWVYSFGDTPKFGISPLYSYGSPNLQWEEAIMSNIGIDFIGFNRRLEITAEFYNKEYEKLITQRALKYIYGLSHNAEPPIVNSGDMRNRGIEFNIIFKKQEGNLRYNISANLTTINNKITALPDDANGEIKNNITRILIGQPVGAYYGYVAERILQVSDFVTDENGKLVQNSSGQYIALVPTQETLTGPGDIKFKDLNNDGKITDRDRTIIGKAVPDLTFGLGFDFFYGNFDLNLFFNGVYNIDVYNQFHSHSGLAAGESTSHDENKLTDVSSYWTPENPIDDQTGIGISDFNFNSRFSSWWLEDASYLRLKNLQIGYTFSEKIISHIGISKLRLYVGGENLLVLTKYKGYDPEISSKDILKGNVDNGTYPVPRIFNFGLSANF